MAGKPTRRVSATSARVHTRKPKKSGSSFALSPKIIAQVAIVVLVGYAYMAIRPVAPKICGSPGGPQVTSPRIKLRDGRYLAYKEKGVAKEEAKHKIIIVHGFGDSKDFNIPLSEEFVKEFGVYLLSFDRAGYGESDPNPTRSVKSEAFDIEELADKLQVGPKFFVVGISLGAYSAYSCLKHIPHRLSGAALVVPSVNYWWPCFPAELSREALGTMLVQDQWTFRVAHYAPWLLNFWMTQKWIPSLSLLQGKLDGFRYPDLEIVKQMSEAPKENEEKAVQQGVHESLHRDLIVAFGNWEFQPTDIMNPFPNNEGAVHIWQGYEDGFVQYQLNRYISQQLPWIRYHEISDAGHFMIYNASISEAIFKALLSP